MRNEGHCGRSVLHFAFIVGPKDFPDYQGTEMNLPRGSLFVTAGLSDPGTLPIWSGRFSLQETDVQIHFEDCCASRGIAHQIRKQLRRYNDEEFATTPVQSAAAGSETYIESWLLSIRRRFFSFRSRGYFSAGLMDCVPKSPA